VACCHSTARGSTWAKPIQAPPRQHQAASAGARRDARLFTFAKYRAAVPLYVVRHAKAGSRSDFDGDDIDRPLTNSGRKQATVLAERLASVSPTVIVSSPYRRCVETVEPLAIAIDASVQVDERLAEFASENVRPDASLFDLLYSLPDRAVVCSHGDVIPAIIESLAGSGMRVNGSAEWGKGSVWVLQRETNRFISALAWPPPVVD
jgi:broad specificity phosphatase PhoE